MHADRNAADEKEKRKRAKCSSAEMKQSKRKLTWSQIIKSNKNKGENVTVCSCRIWGGSNCLCFVASSVLNVSYSFGVSSSKGFPPAQTIYKVPQVAMDWHYRLEDLFLNTFFPNYIGFSHLHPSKTVIISLLDKTLLTYVLHTLIFKVIVAQLRTNPLWDKRREGTESLDN